MNSNERDSRQIESAPTALLDPRVTDPASVRPNRGVTVLGASLHFSGRPPELRGFEEREFADRYTALSVLGEGGMGEVRLSHDARIGRDVAMKVIRVAHGARPEYRARFLREVRVQGQLEHPSIVPVYDLGIGADGATYFTMKRIHGLTLADVLDHLRLKDPAAIAQYSLRKLLAAFQSACLAVEFAHSRGVIHRDLKPTNIMLGDFGEVYVLDWGIAKIKSDPDDPASEVAASKIVSGDAIETQVGCFVGTLGYLSPEQLAGEDLDGRSDVYSLGAILFEMLTLAPLHFGSPNKIAQSTGADVDARCSVRVPDCEVPPELEEICVVATKLHRSDRFESARHLHDAIGRYLDGDRDLERRKSLAAQHLEVAETEIVAAMRDAARGAEHRAAALGELGRALALDPTNEGALGNIAGLLLEPPRELPPEVRADMKRSHEASQRSIAFTGAVAFPGGLVLMLPLFISMGVTNWTSIAIVVVSLLAATILCMVQLRRPSHKTSYFVMTAVAITVGAMTRVYGPLVLMPEMAMATAMVYAMHPIKRVQFVSVALMGLALGVPLLLEQVGVLRASYLFRNGEMVIMPHVCEFTSRLTIGFLALFTMFLLLLCNQTIRKIRNALTAAEERLSMQAWQLRQLVPERARHSFRERRR